MDQMPGERVRVRRGRHVENRKEQRVVIGLEQGDKVGRRPCVDLARRRHDAGIDKAVKVGRGRHSRLAGPPLVEHECAHGAEEQRRGRGGRDGCDDHPIERGVVVSVSGQDGDHKG
eukprot:Amastigsp_a849163_12.p7 type:complete len:116 gc:universal Amastigsp_a849163_12:678-331(-)